MQLETFRGRELRQVIDWTKSTLGEDAMILRTQVLRREMGDVYEVVAARADSVTTFLRRLGGDEALTLKRRGGRAGPYVLGLVGPSGAGKTAATVKLALHPRGLGKLTVGLVTLDTYRPGAVEELQSYAEITGLALEVAYHPREVPGILERLRGNDVVLVDTPGRPFHQKDGSQGWVELLKALDPDEVHLVVPAGLRDEVAARVRDRFSPCGVTHALFTRLDEVNELEPLIKLAGSLRLPARWVSDGPEIPQDLAHAASRILSWGATDGSAATAVRRAG